MENSNPRFLANILRPIAGSDREPLLSLEEACESLYSLIPDLSQYIWILERSCQNPDDGLTSDESASIHFYTMEWPDSEESLYSKLNRALRNVNRQELRPWFRFFKLPSVKDVVIYLLSILIQLNKHDTLHIIHLNEQQSRFPFPGAEQHEKLQNSIRRRITFAYLEGQILATHDPSDISNGYDNLCLSK